MKVRRIGAPVFFSIGAVVDFVFDCVKECSILAGLVFNACGLPLTAFLYFAHKAGSSGDQGQE